MFELTGCESKEELKGLLSEIVEPEDQTCPEFNYENSEGLLMIYEGSINYVLEYAKEEDLYYLSGGKPLTTLQTLRSQILSLLS